MDKAAQNQNQTNDNTQSPVPSQPQDQAQPSVTSVGVGAGAGSINKEAEMAPVGDFVKPSETPLVKDREVAEAGVKEVLQSAELTKEHERIGVKPSAEATPVQIEPSGNVQLPMTQVQATQVLQKSKNIKDSLVWLAILMIKHFKKMHRKLLKGGA